MDLAIFYLYDWRDNNKRLHIVNIWDRNIYLAFSDLH